jgi:hypothetical protein
MPAQEGFRLDDEQALAPGPQAAGQQDQQRAIPGGAARPCDRAPQDDQLLPEQRILEDEFGLAAGKIGQRAGEERSGSGAGGSQEAITEHLRYRASRSHKVR